MASDHIHIPRTLFAAIALLIGGSMLLTYTFGVRVLQIRATTNVHRRVMTEALSVLSTLQDAETGQRGFLLTGDDAYLKPYDEALRRMPGELAILNSGRPGGTSSRLAAAVNDKLSELRATIERRRSAGFDAALALVQTGAGKQKMDGARDIVGRLVADEQRLVDTESARADAATRTRTIVFIVCGVGSLLFVGWAFRRITNVLLGREHARREAHRQKEYLRVTLASIGDCVIVTDTAGRITFMNKCAQKTTGWSHEEAQGRPAADVFRIVNEYTRAPAESPVQKVLESGVVAGLADHTILICKDGTELPIDDSGAPIRDDAGELHGVILVFRDFTDYRSAAAKMQAAQETAEAANASKDKFLAMLSHELRTPLAPVLNTLELWEHSADVPPAMKPEVQMLRRNIELEARIIEDLLDITRIGRGMIAINRELMNVHDLIRYLLMMLRSNITGKHLSLSLSLGAARAHIDTDASRLQQVLWNIFNNAIKFSDDGGALTVTTSNDALNNLRIEIVDTGLGMSRETLERLFNPFEQADRSYRNPGLGLGLAISRGLVDLLGGKIVASSGGLGQGSTFVVTFPTADAPVSTAPEGARPTVSPVQRPLRILLIEDHEDTSRALSRLLSSRNHTVEIARTLSAAIAAVDDGKKFDLIICDIGLPDGSGIDLIRHLRETSSTPALALSGFGNTEDIAKAKDAGFDAHLTKPVNFQRLESTMWQLTSAVENQPILTSATKVPTGSLMDLV